VSRWQGAFRLHPREVGRHFWLMAGLALAPAAVAQAPPVALVPRLESPRQVEIPPGSALFLTEKELEEFKETGIPPNRQPSCPVDYSEIEAEKQVSDEHLRQMKRKLEVIPLKDQYEQELYYQDRRAKLYEKTCGNGAKYTIRPEPTGMTWKACEIIAADCKPVKHW